MKMLWARGALTAGFLAMSAWAAPCSTQAQDLADRQREDITFLRQHYLPREQAFTQNSRAAAERYIDQLESRAGSLSDAQLFLGFARVAALADNAHSIAGIGHSYDPGPRLPLVITWFDDAGLVILRALPPNEDLAGGEITAINGRPAAEVMDAFRQYYGGPATRRNILVPSLLSTPSMLVAAGLADTTSSVLVRVTLTDGTEVERNIATVPRATLGASAWWPSRWWSPEPIGEDTTAWATAISTEDLPLYLRD
ncbi:MAG: hypothetical protein KDA35_07750, partial [Hyphomonadaceae bacterium]|nr:hypothetical protein [Hyphomonadaceae bacterium]